MKITTIAHSLAILFCFSGALSVSAQTIPFYQSPCSGKVVPIDAVPGGGVLYKAENIHGGRGPSFLVQNVSQRTNKQSLEIRDAYCRPIATIGLFRTDQPYGSRYYMRTGGTGQGADELLNLTKPTGSTAILIEGVNGTWIRVKNPLNREGSVRK